MKLLQLQVKFLQRLLSLCLLTQSLKVMLLIENFVTAADQLYKADDPTGVIRKKYVEDQLKALGYAITDELNAFIESAVKKCNKEYNK